MTQPGIPVEHAISFVIRRAEDPGQVLIVLRPEDDEDLPNVWGLPAGSRTAAESWEQAVERAGTNKLGVRLRVGRLLNAGENERAEYTLRMRLYEAEIAAGEPRVPQPYPEVTQYRELAWGSADALRPAADQGSLCCRLFLDAER